MRSQLLTTRGQAGAGGSVATGLLQAGVRKQDAAQLQLRQAHHLCVARALVLQWQLVVIQHHRVQAALETLQHPRVLLGVHEAARVGVLHLRREQSEIHTWSYKDELKLFFTRTE